jgi:hypothetical protein
MSANEQFFITGRTWGIVGLDDMARYTDVERVPVYTGYQCIGTREALIDLVTEIADRATEGEDGYNHDARDKAILRRALRRLARAGWEPRP